MKRVASIAGRTIAATQRFAANMLLLVLVLLWPSVAVAQGDFLGCLYLDGGIREAGVFGSPLSASQRADALMRIEELRSRLDIHQSIPVEFGYNDIFVSANCKFPDGKRVAKIVVGPALYTKIEEVSGREIDMVLAHEIAHVLQYSDDRDLVRDLCESKSTTKTKNIELVADIYAGYSMRKTSPQSDAKDLIIALSSLADYNFARNDHHGKVSERITAFNLGQALAMDERQLTMALLMRKVDELAAYLTPGRTGAASGAEQAGLYFNAIDRVFEE